MSDSDRKRATRDEPERSGARRRSKPEAESKKAEAEESKQEAASKPAEQSSGKGDSAGGLDESGKMSSLLENTGEDVRQLLKAADDAAKQIREAARTEVGDSKAESVTSSEDTGSLVGRINREVQQVLETADDAADKIREEARGEARQVVEEARRRAETVTKQQMDRVSEMTSQVAAELSAVQSKLERLQAAYDEALKRMGADLEIEQPRVWETKQNGEVDAEEKEGEALRRRLGKRTPRKGAAEPEEISEGARLLALQQMMAGVDPKVIEGRLRNEFHIEDPKPILDWMGLHAPHSSPTKKTKKK